MQGKPIEKSILETLALFGLFQRPLTAAELEIYLWQNRANISQIKNALFNLIQQKDIVSQNGYYALPDQDKIFPEFFKRQKISHQKLIIAKRAARVLQWVPFLRGIFITQGLSLQNCKKDSDIDLLIITDSNKLWLSRALVISTIFLIGLRKSEKNKKDKICLGFYLAEDSLNIQKTALKNFDILVPYWLTTTLPLYSFANYFRFFYANNWIGNLIPNYKLKLRQDFGQIQIKESTVLRDWRNLFEWLLGGIWGNALNFILGKIQILKIFADPKTKNPTANIWADDKIIELHHFSQRKDVLNKWQKKIKNISVSKFKNKNQMKIINFVLK